MKLLLLIPLLLLSFTACGDDGQGPNAPTDFSWKDAKDPVTGKEYRCLYYRDKGGDGGSALWCDRKDKS